MFTRRNLGGSPPENYQRFFVPVIGAPIAHDLLRMARLQPGEKVLDVACGTGVATRLAANAVGPEGRVVGTDIEPGMIDVARRHTSPESPIEWHVAPAENLPLQDKTFDVVMCQLALQLFENRERALAEMHRVLAPGGRLVVIVPGKIAPVFVAMAEGLGQHFDPQTGGFVQKVFSLHDPEEIHRLINSSGLQNVKVDVMEKRLRLPAPQDFLWQYLHSTPLAQAISTADDATLDALERDIVGKWSVFVENGALMYQQNVVYATAEK